MTDQSIVSNPGCLRYSTQSTINPCLSRSRSRSAGSSCTIPRRSPTSWCSCCRAASVATPSSSVGTWFGRLVSLSPECGCRPNQRGGEGEDGTGSAAPPGSGATHGEDALGSQRSANSTYSWSQSAQSPSPSQALQPTDAPPALLQQRSLHDEPASQSEASLHGLPGRRLAAFFGLAVVRRTLFASRARGTEDDTSASTLGSPALGVSVAT